MPPPPTDERQRLVGVDLVHDIDNDTCNDLTSDMADHASRISMLLSWRDLAVRSLVCCRRKTQIAAAAPLLYCRSKWQHHPIVVRGGRAHRIHFFLVRIGCRENTRILTSIVLFSHPSSSHPFSPAFHFTEDRGPIHMPCPYGPKASSVEPPWQSQPPSSSYWASFAPRRSSWEVASSR